MKFFPHRLEFPAVAYSDYLQQASLDLLAALKDKRLHTHPTTLNYDNSTNTAIQEIAEVLGRVANKPTPIKIRNNMQHNATNGHALPRVKNIHPSQTRKSAPHPRARLIPYRLQKTSKKCKGQHLTEQILHIYNEDTGKKGNIRLSSTR